MPKKYQLLRLPPITPRNPYVLKPSCAQSIGGLMGGHWQHNALTWNLWSPGNIMPSPGTYSQWNMTYNDDDDVDADDDNNDDEDDNDDHVGIIVRKHCFILHHIYSGIRSDINGVP